MAQVLTFKAPDIVRFDHRFFTSFPDACFRFDEGEGVPVSAFWLGQQQVALPFAGIKREFGIREYAHDAIMLNTIARGLRFVSLLQTGDPIPPELLTGDASWEPTELHRIRARNRIGAQLVGWHGRNSVPLSDPVGLEKFIAHHVNDASVALVAALEGATFAPRLAELPADLDDAPDSAVEPIYVVINGETGDANPSRQGLESALADGLQPLNVTGDIPTLGDGYSPLWASHPVNWADTSLDRRWRITSEADVRGLAGLRLVHGPGGRAIGADGILVNCPEIARCD
ncbi:MAG: hypothetical protein VW516_03305 [Rhodospirillaceae bacterium]